MTYICTYVELTGIGLKIEINIYVNVHVYTYMATYLHTYKNYYVIRIWAFCLLSFIQSASLLY